MDQQNEKLELSLVELFLYLKKKLIIIVATALLFGLAGYIYNTVFVEPQYTAETSIYVLNRTNSSAVVSSDFQTSTYLLRDYQVLITGQNVTKKVVAELDLKMSHTSLSRKIDVSAHNNTRVLQIRVTDTDPQRAADIANAVRSIATKQITEIMEVDAVHLIYEADVPTRPSSIQLPQKVCITALIGLGLALIVFITIFVLDDTIRNEEDVAHYLGLSVIGVIPASSDMLTAREEDSLRKRTRLLRKKRKHRK